VCAKNLSNKEMTKIKVADIHELNNFGMYHFLCWNQFGPQILVRTCRFSKFQIWNVQILSNDKMTKIKVVDINELNNFGIHYFLC
jgi:ferredoxin-fold anticodon binding domain-containing protein